MDIKARFSTKVEPCFDCCSRGINRYYELKIIVGEDSTAYEIKDTEYEQHKAMIFLGTIKEINEMSLILTPIKNSSHNIWKSIHSICEGGNIVCNNYVTLCHPMLLQ